MSVGDATGAFETTRGGSPLSVMTPGNAHTSVTERHVNTTLDLTTRLEEMQDEYTYQVNMLLEENREDLAARLVDQYTEEATRVLRSVQN
jgi:hypothetical protein